MLMMVFANMNVKIFTKIILFFFACSLQVVKGKTFDIILLCFSTTKMDCGT